MNLVEGEGGLRWLEASLGEGVFPGPLKGAVVVEPSSEGSEAIEVPVRGYVVGPIRATPTTAFLGLLSRVRNRSISVELTSDDRDARENVTVVSIEGNTEGVVTCELTHGPNRSYLTVTADYEKAVVSEQTSFEGVIRLQGPSGVVKLNVPVLFFAKPEPGLHSVSAGFLMRAPP